MSQNGKPAPQLDAGSAKALNLTVLQRMDPYVEDILITAAHVTFYEFNLELNQWSRKDVEGSLFVVKRYDRGAILQWCRNAQPRFQFIVMNRRNTDNLVEDLLGDFEFEVQVPYLLYRNGAQEVNGIWFYDAHDCEAVASLFSRILNAYSKVQPKPKISSNKSEFEELEAVPSLSMMEEPLEPPASSTAPSVPDVPEDSFVNYFSAAMSIGNAPNAIAGQPLPPTATVLLNSHTPSAIPSLPAFQPTPSLPMSSHMKPFFDTHESSSINSTNHVTNLVKPSFFAPSSSPTVVSPPASSTPTAPPLHPPVTLQRPHGTPFLQPFPPPTPSPSLTPPISVPFITRDKFRDAFLRLVQNDQFVDMVYQEIMNAHNLPY